MNTTMKRIVALLLTIALSVSLAACGNDIQPDIETQAITVDQSGIATWQPVEGAVYYAYCIVDAGYVSLSEDTIADTQIQLPEGRSVHVRAVFADGSYGDWMISDYYGEPTLWEAEQGGENVDVDVDVDVDANDDRNETRKINIACNEAGWVSWNSVENATEYECRFITPEDVLYEDATIVTDTTVRVPLGCRVVVTPMSENGLPLDMTIVSDYHGGTDNPVMEYIDDAYEMRYTARISEGKTYNLIENIDYSTVQTDADGKVTFTAVGPKGETMRFFGYGITVTEGAIKIEPSGVCYALDAIGRICAYKPVISDCGVSGTSVDFTGGYSLNGKTSVADESELFTAWPISIDTQTATEETYGFTPIMHYQPNMIGFGGSELNGSSFTLSELTVYYDETTYAAPLSKLLLNYEFYGSYIEGDLYDPSKEVYDSENEIYTFYLMLFPELQNEVYPLTSDYKIDVAPYISRALLDIPMDRIEIGDLKDPNGNVMNKETDPLSVGCTLEITVAGKTYDMELPILARAGGVQTLHELTPYSNIPSTGDVTSLVVPVRWSNYAESSPEGRLDMIRELLGRVKDENGVVTDYGTDCNSLSAYYDTVSGGKYHIDSFLTDWVTVPYAVEEGINLDPLNHSLPDEIFEAVQEMYPQLDWSQFDRNADGIVDSVIYISAAPESDTIFMSSFLGGVRYARGYTAERAGTSESPNLKDFICIGTGVLDADDKVILHEYAHNFGIIDYYDVSYKGIDAVGQFDMQSGSYGDWNAYSKYAVGWIEPEVVTGLADGESVDITIGSMTETGDAIVIPAAGTNFGGPFGEYILVDLFTATGVNEEDAAESFDLTDEVGVRIYHVNTTMERRVLTDKYGDHSVVGTANIANNYKDSGKYHIELLQHGGDNTFTDLSNLRTQLAPQDLFHAGDDFDAEQYSEFLTDGQMDDGSEFGYIIQILSIEENGADSTATIRITKK